MEVSEEGPPFLRHQHRMICPLSCSTPPFSDAAFIHRSAGTYQRRPPRHGPRHIPPSILVYAPLFVRSRSQTKPIREYACPSAGADVTERRPVPSIGGSMPIRTAYTATIDYVQILDEHGVLDEKLARQCPEPLTD